MLQLLIAIVVVGGCFVLGNKIFDFETVVEQHRRAAGVIAGVLDRYGLTRLAAILRSFSVGDTSGWVDGLIDLAKELDKSEDAIIAELDEVFDRVLDNKLTDPTSRAYIVARVAAIQPTTTSSPVAVA